MELIAPIRRSPFVIPLAFMAAAGMMLISEESYRRSVAVLGRLGLMATARTNVQLLERSLLDAETSQRGYLLTGRKHHLQPYENSLRRIEQALGFLDAYYGKEPYSAGVVTKLRGLAATRMSGLALAIRLHDEGKAEAANEVILSDMGKEQMDTVHTLTNDLLQHDSLSVATGREGVYDMLLLSRIGMALLSVASLVALGLYLRNSLALEAQQTDQQRMMQAERDRLEDQVSKRTTQLTELTQHLQAAREDERSRLARDLHDELGALFTSAKLDAARIRSRLSGGSPEVQERLNHLIETLNIGIALKRRIIEDLHPSALSNLGLVATLEILMREFGARSGIKIHCELEPVSLDETCDLVVYRLVQESVTNIAKYAKASQVWLTLATDGQNVRVEVRDDGVGFDPAVVPSSTHGLVGMRYRVEAEGGTVAVESAPGQGTRIRVSLPQTVAAETAEPNS